MRTTKTKSDDRALREKLALYKAMSHPLRFKILSILGRREASPNEVAEELDERLNNVAYHFREMWKADVIELVGTDTRNGGTIHIYKKKVEAVLNLADAESLTRLENEIVSSQIIQDVVGDFAQAVEAGTMDSHAARSLLRQPLTFDEEGMRKSAELTERLREELAEVEAESLGRMAQTGEQGINIAAAILVFEMGSTD